MTPNNPKRQRLHPEAARAHVAEEVDVGPLAVKDALGGVEINALVIGSEDQPIPEHPPQQYGHANENRGRAETLRHCARHPAPIFRPRRKKAGPSHASTGPGRCPRCGSVPRSACSDPAAGDWRGTRAFRPNPGK